MKKVKNAENESSTSDEDLALIKNAVDYSSSALGEEAWINTDDITEDLLIGT